MKNILAVLPEGAEKYRDILNKTAEGCVVKYLSPGEVTEKDVDEANVIIGNVPPALLHEQNLEFVQLTSAGADAYVKEGLLKRDTILCCCTGAYSQTVAEHAVAATLMLQKGLHLYRDAQSRSEWIKGGSTSSMNGATVIIVGLGDIGCCYARQVKALGAYVIGVKRRLSEKPEYVDELYTTDAFDDIVARGDVIVSILPGTDATYHFFTEERFAKMKKSAIFVNCGRGTAVSCDTLFNVLSNNIIASAAVDVFETEPLPETSPLWKLENLVLTPHASGFFHLPATMDRVMNICIGNLKAWLNGKNPVNIVDYNTGYKK